MSQATEKKAQQYLAQGRVVALSVSTDRGKFQVAGSRSEPYNVKFYGEWFCDCEARVEICSHILACQKITKFESGRELSFGGGISELLNASFN